MKNFVWLHIKTGFLLGSVLFFVPSIAVELKDLKARVDFKKTPTADLSTKPHAIVGTCDGTAFESQAEYDGCKRNEQARFLKSPIPVNPRPVKTIEDSL